MKTTTYLIAALALTAMMARPAASASSGDAATGVSLESFIQARGGKLDGWIQVASEKGYDLYGTLVVKVNGAPVASMSVQTGDREVLLANLGSAQDARSIDISFEGEVRIDGRPVLVSERMSELYRLTNAALRAPLMRSLPGKLPPTGPL